MFTPHIRRKEEGSEEKEKKERKEGKRKQEKEEEKEEGQKQASLPKGMDMPISLIMLLIS